MSTKNIITLTKKINDIMEMMKDFDKRLSAIENIINVIEEPIVNDIIDIQPQEFEIDNNIVKNCLEGNSIKSDIVLVKEMYFKEDVIPIRYNINKNIECRINGDWKCDDVYMFNTIISNIKSCYLRINNFDNYENNLEQFMKNQEYIMKITTDDYLKNFVKMFNLMLSKIK